MIIIYSSDKIDGLVGIYANPLYFTECNKKATEIFTDDAKIKKAYEGIEVKVSPLSKETEVKKTRKTKKAE